MPETEEQVKHAIDAGAEKTKEATDKAAEKSSETAKGVAKAVKDAGTKIADSDTDGGQGGLISVASTVVARAADTAREYAERAGEPVQQVYHRAEAIARHRPGSAVVSAFSIGIFVGVALVLAVRHR